jgi:hypothetical protein
MPDDHRPAIPQVTAVDDRFGTHSRNAKNTGIEHLPSKSYEINQAWCVAAMIACDLLC